MSSDEHSSSFSIMALPFEQVGLRLRSLLRFWRDFKDLAWTSTEPISFEMKPSTFWRLLMKLRRYLLSCSPSSCSSHSRIISLTVLIFLGSRNSSSSIFSFGSWLCFRIEFRELKCSESQLESSENRDRKFLPGPFSQSFS